MRVVRHPLTCRSAGHARMCEGSTRNCKDCAGRCTRLDLSPRWPLLTTYARHTASCPPPLPGPGHPTCSTPHPYAARAQPLPSSSSLQVPPLAQLRGAGGGGRRVARQPATPARSRDPRRGPMAAGAGARHGHRHGCGGQRPRRGRAATTPCGGEPRCRPGRSGTSACMLHCCIVDVSHIAKCGVSAPCPLCACCRWSKRWTNARY